MTDLHPSPLHPADGLKVGAAAGSPNLAAFPASDVPDLRPLAAFLDLALPLDANCSILELTPPARSGDETEAALSRALEAEVRAGRLIELGTHVVVDDRGREWDEPVYGLPEDVLADVEAAHRYHDQVNDYPCEGEAA